MTPLIEILQSWGCPFAEKSPFSVKAKIFSSGYLLFEEKMYIVI